ncbi:mevalonate kinase [Candidatus Gottesmanbacteria bacterium]|nr:mevalonate kinase [Candidatus Gottesmanbacteria bacterium]
MKQIAVSVPGKLMLMGEHAVIYGRPCIVTAIDQRIITTAELLEESIFKLEAPDVKVTGYQKTTADLGKGEIPKEAKFAELAVLNFLNAYKISKGIKIITKSPFSANFGFGSSAGTVVGIIKSLSELFSVTVSQKELFDLSYKTVLDVQGKGSGFDVAAAIYGGTIFFQNKGEVIESLTADGLNLVIGYCGVKADTVSMINSVESKMKNYKAGIDKIFDNIGGLVIEAKSAILEKDWERLGTLMDYNQNYLEDLAVSTEKLNNMIEGAKKSGAYGTKLSGAGGGDCMVALVSEEKKLKVTQAIEVVGGQVINVTPNAPGVKVENI